MDAGATAEHFLGETVTPETLLEPLPDAAATAIIERLKQEADRHWDINPRRSLEFANRIIAIGKARGDARQTALGIMARGDALKFLGETDEAWSMLEQAGEMFLEAGDEVGWARTRIGRLHLGIMLNRVEQTLAEAQPAREILLRHGETEKLMRLIFMTAYVYNYLGDQQKTLELYRPALEMALSFGKSGQVHAGKIIMNMGVAYENLGELGQALDHYQRAYEIFLRLNEPMLIALVESSLASIAQAQGRYRQALRLLNSALEHMGACAEVEDIARTNWHVLDCYLNLHRLSEARPLAKQIVAYFRSVNDLFELSRSLLQLATTEAESGNFQAAQAALDEAEAIFDAEGATLWSAITRLKRGHVALRQGNLEAAMKNAGQAAASFEAAGQKFEHAFARLLQAQVWLALKEPAKAWTAGQEVLRFAQRYAIPALRYSAHLLLGQASEKREDGLRAERHYRAAAATSERVQRGLTITLRPGFLEDRSEAWHRLIGMQLQSGKAGQAFEILERAKSQVLLGYLANRESLRWAQDDPHSRELIAELERLRSEHQIYYRRAHELPSMLHSSGVNTQEGSLGEVKSRERRMRAITEQLYLFNGEGRTENPAPSPTLEDLQNKLDERTMLIEYYFVGSQAWVFTIDQQTIQVHELTLPSEMLEQLQAQLRVNTAAALRLDPRSQAAGSLAKHAQRILQRLYAILIEPFKTRLQAVERLIIVPYGSLHALPFHLLYDGSTYLIENYELVTLPAAGLATQTGPQRTPGALTLAH
jgi:tetratricopeptide (TPR) repeat protein